MTQQIEVVYENGVLRPLGPLPAPFHEHQRLTVTIEGPVPPDHWLDDADPSISLDAVRQALAKAPGTIAQAVYDEREER